MVPIFVHPVYSKFDPNFECLLKVNVLATWLRKSYVQKLNIYNVEQKFVDKLTKLSKTDFSMECFAADILRDFVRGVTIWLLGGWLRACYQIQAFQGFSCNFLRFRGFLLRSYVLSRSPTSEVTRTFTFLS